MKHSRYAILVIVTIAAIVTPTTDAVNLLLFSVPMCLLFFLGLFASYLLVLKRESRGPVAGVPEVAGGVPVPGGVRCGDRDEVSAMNFIFTTETQRRGETQSQNRRARRGQSAEGWLTQRSEGAEFR